MVHLSGLVRGGRRKRGSSSRNHANSSCTETSHNKPKTSYVNNETQIEKTRVALLGPLSDPPSSISHAKPVNATSDVCDDSFVIGVCQLMCPAAERAEREEFGDISPFETNIKTSQLEAMLSQPKNFFKGSATKLQSTASLAVKKFRRSAAGSSRGQFDAELVRPPKVLLAATQHIIAIYDTHKELLQHNAQVFAQYYSFSSDRFRAIRQDFVVQGCNPGNCSEYFKVLHIQQRFHIHCYFYLQCTIEAEDHPIPCYSPKLALEQVTQCLAPLYSMLCDVQCREDYGPGFSNIHVGQLQEILSSWVLLNSHSSMIAVILSNIPYYWLKEASCLTQVIQALSEYQSGNYRMFLIKISKLQHESTLLQCAIPMVVRAQAKCLSVFNKAFTHREQIPFSFVEHIVRATWPHSVSAQVTKWCQEMKLDIENTDAFQDENQLPVIRFHTPASVSLEVAQMQVTDVPLWQLKVSSCSVHGAPNLSKLCENIDRVAFPRDG